MLEGFPVVAEQRAWFPPSWLDHLKHHNSKINKVINIYVYQCLSKSRSKETNEVNFILDFSMCILQIQNFHLICLCNTKAQPEIDVFRPAQMDD